MTRKGLIYVAIVALLLVFWYVKRFQRDATIDAQIVSRQLPPDDKAKVVIDTKKHEIVAIKRGGGPNDKPTVTKEYLPPQTSIEIGNDGSIKVTGRKWGTEIWPFSGVGIDAQGHGRVVVGVNALYFRRWEMGGGLSLGVLGARDVRAFVSGSYNFYSNAVIGIGVDNHRTVNAFVAIKF